MKFYESNPPVPLLCCYRQVEFFLKIKVNQRPLLLQWPKASPTVASCNYSCWSPTEKICTASLIYTSTLKSSHVLFIQISTYSIYLNIPVATTAAGALQRKFGQPPSYIPSTLKSSRVLFIQISTREKY